MLQVFQLFSVGYVASILSECYKSRSGVAHVFSGVLQVFQTYVASVLIVFGCKLQVFHLDVTKVD
jgi:hypothetical protein